MPNVYFLHNNVQIHVENGTTVLQAACKAGLEVDAPCGGNGTCGKCKAKINGQQSLACQYPVTSDTVVELPQNKKLEILSDGIIAEISADPVAPGHLIAFDIGTTSLVCFLMAPGGNVMSTRSMYNPQAVYGADVISRIQCAINGQLHTLTAAIRGGMSKLLKQCCTDAGISPEEIGVISIVGNPCMQQLFMGISPQNLAQVPFAPVLTEAAIHSASLYFPECCSAKVLIVPDIAGYVGADTMGCILAGQMHNAEDTVLMVDIGTNGEMVLSRKGRMVACSTAAGPALEGANIRFGMRGTSGAIDHVWLESGSICSSVIGGGDACGICGSGIIDAVAVLLDLKRINKRGRIQSAEEIDGERIVWITEHLYLTQEDIRQMQMAKGAIAAGIHLMCAHLGITVQEIDRVILAGAFGSFLNPDSACRIGLLPAELLGRITAAGNIAGAGARMLAVNRHQLPLAQKLRDRTESIELSEIPAFQRTFARCMAFIE